MTTIIEAVRVGQSETAALIPDPEAQPVMAIKEVQRIFPVDALRSDPAGGHSRHKGWEPVVDPHGGRSTAPATGSGGR